MATANLHKAAVLLLTLPKGRAVDLLGRLDAAQSATVIDAMSRLGEIDQGEQAAVAREFAAANGAVVGDDSIEEAPPFQFLSEVDSEVLIDAVADEHPQIIALVLSYLPARQAAVLLSGLPSEQQISVVCRLAAMQEPDREAVRDVEQGLWTRLYGADDEPAARRGVASVVNVLHAMEPATERRLLGDLAAAAPDVLREIRQAMFGVDVSALAESDVTSAAG